MTVTAWADHLSLSLERYGIVARLDDPTRWREWAAQVNSLPAVARLSPPDPFQFGDWRDWAVRLTAVLDNLAGV